MVSEAAFQSARKQSAPTLCRLTTDQEVAGSNPSGRTLVEPVEKATLNRQNAGTATRPEWALGDCHQLGPESAFALEQDLFDVDRSPCYYRSLSVCPRTSQV